MADRDTADARRSAKQGEPCEECGAPLAADQRYCLNCGQRRGEPRVDYRQLHAAAERGERAAPREQPERPGQPAGGAAQGASATTRRWPRSAASRCSA